MLRPYGYDGPLLVGTAVFLRSRPATARCHAPTHLRRAPVSARAGRAACSRRRPDPPWRAGYVSVAAAFSVGCRFIGAVVARRICSMHGAAEDHGQWTAVGSGGLGASAGSGPPCPGLPRHDLDHAAADDTPPPSVRLFDIGTHPAPSLTRGRPAREASALCFF